MRFEPQFTARIDARNRVAKVALRGELDMATVPILTDHLVHLEHTDIDAIMIDLRDLTFLDCAALHAFLEGRDHAEQNGHVLILIGARASARRLFELTGTEFLLDADAAAGVISQFSGDGARRTDETASSGVDA